MGQTASYFKSEERDPLLGAANEEENSGEEEEDKYPVLGPRTLGHIPFSKVHELCHPFDDLKEDPFIPGCEIHVKIIDVEINPSAHFNPYLYVIKVEHASFEWTVQHRYRQFFHLNNQLILYRASLIIHLPTRRHKEKMKTFKTKKLPHVPHFPVKPDILVSKEELPERKRIFEKYLQELMKLQGFRCYHETLVFFGISPLSFVKELGTKGIEGYVEKRSGGYTATSFVKSVRNICAQCCGNWRMRWMLVKDNFVAYMKPSDGRVRGVLLMDHDFSVKYGKDQTGKSDAVVISNMSRHLLLKCRSERQAAEWAAGIERAVKKAGFEFIEASQHNSFAPPRPHSQCRWIIDGATYFDSVASALEKAKEEIFISDWWLTPEIYLRRPTFHGHYWQLDHILKRKAIQGIKIFVLLYKELELALGINSLYSQLKLSRLHKNIKVLRHPTVAEGVLLWAHHEKIVCVDQTYAFVGGLDLCYGRWDDYQHRLTDLGEVESKVDIKRHTSSISPTQVLLKHKRSLSDSDVASIPKKNQELYQSQPQDDCQMATPLRKSLSRPGKLVHELLDNSQADNKTPAKRRWKVAAKKLHAVGTFQNMKNQLSLERVREGANKDVCLNSLPSPADAHRAIQEMALVHLGLERKFKLWHGKDYSNFISKDLNKLNEPYEDSVNRQETPRMPWHDVSCFVQGAAARDVARHFIQRWNFTKLETVKFDDAYPILLPKSYDFLDAIPPILSSEIGSVQIANCQILRSTSLWSAGISSTEHSILSAYEDAIMKAEHFIYIENQFFVSLEHGSKDVFNSIAECLYQRIMKAHQENKMFRVYVVMPLLPAFEGEVGTGTGTLIQAVTHWNYSSICRGPKSLCQRLAKSIKDPLSYVSFYGLRNFGVLNDKLITELIYVHSKLMIVDDKTAIIGSANINDRSLLGRRDSEIAILVNDSVFVDSVVDGKPYKAGHFCHTLRKALFKEHLGLLDEKHSKTDIRDPVCESFFQDVWLKTASRNTVIFEKVFNCIPSDQVRNFAQLKTYNSVEPLATKDRDAAVQMLHYIQGYLVILPYYFLCEESLTPSLSTKEGFLPNSVFT